MKESDQSEDLLGGDAGRLEEERTEDGDAPRLQPRDLADAGDGTDETAVPEGHDGPGEDEGEENEEGDEADDCGQDETDFHVMFVMWLVVKSCVTIYQ